MTFGSRIAAAPLLAFMVIGAIIGATNAKPPSRIYGGVNAEHGEFKWMVSLGLGYPNHQCGGAIISSRYILTAAHCLEGETPRSLIVRSGMVDLRNKNAIESKIARLIIHPGYVTPIPGVRLLRNDIGIVELKEDLELGERVTAIPLPTKQPERQRASFSGWGDISEDPVIALTRLQTADVQVIDAQECWDMEINPKNPQFFCGYQKHGHILDGDSGGPLISNGELIGLASSGFGIKGLPDSYTNVYHYLGWIKSVIREPLK